MPSLMWPHLRYPREMGAMVEAQARRWALKQRGRGETLVEAARVVTVSREVGDQGAALGRGLAERLGFSYWDRDLVMELARHLTEESGAGAPLDEHTRDAIADFLGSPVPHQVGPSARYTDQIRLIVDSITRRGGAVIVGQGVQFLVDGRCALRACLVTPFELQALEAEGHPFRHPASFDLVVNTDTYKRERAVGLVLMAYLAKFGDWPLTARVLRAARLPLLTSPLPPSDLGLPRTPST